MRRSTTHTGEAQHAANFYRIVYFQFFIACLMITGVVFGQQTIDSTSTISGTVTDGSGTPLELVNVRIKGTTSGTVSDSLGYFSFTTQDSGSHILIASLIGFADKRKQINLKPGATINLDIILRKELLELDELQVNASSFTTGDAEGVTLKPLEVITTPGATADMFRAVKTFPGVSTVDEGSGLFVRGGDVSETKILIDQATVAHPYRFESPTGGARGTIPPFLVKGTYFSSGGFSARYGNALSAVLSMESLGMPQSTSVNLNLGMAAASAGLSTLIVDDKLGVRFSGNRSFTQFLFEVNGQADEFHQAPLGLDGNLSLIYKPSPNTTFKFFNYANRSEIGVRTQEPSFNGVFNSNENNQLHNLQWKQFWNDWLMKISFSFNRFDSRHNLGGFNLNEQDETYKIRTDIKSLIWDDLQVFSGVEWQYTENSFIGSVPDQKNVVDPDASYTTLDEQFGAGRLAAYTEFEFRLTRKILANIGLRSDLQTRTNQVVVDPRLNVLYQFSGFTHLRLATGLYHQFPEPFQYNPETGNPDLQAQRAWHYILGLEHERGLLHLRVEGYYKDYQHLVIDANQPNLSNNGYGESWGADIFVKYSEYLRTRFNGWISYSFLQSDRYQPRDLGSYFDFEKAPSDYDITHNLQVVGKFRLIGNMYAGLGYRFATGHPITPIVDAEFMEEAEYYRPVEGPVNSERLPNFRRFDLDLSYYWPFAEGKSATFYISVSNALNRDNVTNYTYSEDYSQRSPVISNYSRSIYAGVSVTL